MSMQIQGPTAEDASMPMPMENVTGTVRRKGAMRTFPWLLRAAELNLVLPLPASTLPLTVTLSLPPVIEEAPTQDEDEDEDLLIPPVAKRPRLETPLDHALVEDEANMVAVPDDANMVAVAVTPIVTPDITNDDTLVTPSLAAASFANVKAKRARVTLCKWTPEEDAKLTDAFKIFGSRWILVAEKIDGRTNNQCRKRWVDNLAPVAGSCLTGRWTREEDSHLAIAFKQFGNEWSAVATLVPGRSNIQCRQRWARGLDLDNGGTGKGETKARKWTLEEDGKLADAAAKFGNEWTAVAALVAGRTNAQCRQRWVNRLNPANCAKSRKWCPSEDTMLAGAVGEFGNDWTAVASQIDGRTNIQCRQRWLHSLDHAAGGKGTTIGDAKLLQGVQKFGNNWAAVATTVAGRTYGPWTTEENATLTEAVNKLGTNDWPAVSALIPLRGNLQCRERWLNSLLPAQAKWTSEEDMKLIEAVGECGDDWTAVAALVPDRTGVECEKRWARAFGSSNEDKEVCDTDNGDKDG
jgi:hypothetical protein